MRPVRFFHAKDLAEAHRKGMFVQTMTRWEFMDRITRYNPTLKWIANENYRGLYDYNRYICGIAHNCTMPKHTIMKYDAAKDRLLNWSDAEGNITRTEKVNTDDEDGKVLARGWLPALIMVKKRGYRIDERDIEVC